MSKMLLPHVMQQLHRSKESCFREKKAGVDTIPKACGTKEIKTGYPLLWPPSLSNRTSKNGANRQIYTHARAINLQSWL